MTGGVMLDWLDRFVRLADEVRPEKARHLVRLAFISTVAAVIWAVGVGPVAEGLTVWAPLLAFGLAAVVALLIAGLLVLSASGKIIGSAQQQPLPMPGGHHIGCRIGRRRLECGLLHVTGPTTALPEADGIGPVREPDEIRVPPPPHGRFGQSEMYEALGNTLRTLIEQADQRNLTVASIGIAVPGGVIPERGRFDKAVGGVPIEAGEDVAGAVIATLKRICRPDLLQRVFKVDDEEGLQAIIHLDNDARCAARWLITEQGPKWTDFVCVFAGTGVGSGLVFDRHISYGATFRAGEVGHVELNMGDKLELGGMTLQPRHCSCGKHGYHFESLVGIGGLGHLADVLDSRSLTAVLDAYRADTRHQDVLRRLSGDSEEIAGVILLHVLRALSDPTRSVLTADPALQHFLERLMKLYGQLFAVGIAAILDALDLPYVALCGTIPEYLQGNNAFRRAFNQHLAASVLGTPPQHLYGDMRAWGWRGAALLPRDPGYLKHRFPGPPARSPREDRPPASRMRARR